MISSINAATPVHAAAPTTAPTTAAQPAPSKATVQPSAVDTVLISSAAKALSKENLETSAQTAHEASAGDIQAIRLQARHAAARVSIK